MASFRHSDVRTQRTLYGKSTPKAGTMMYSKIGGSNTNRGGWVGADAYLI